MKVAIIGASGKAGRLILQEAIDRGHDITAIVRNASRIADLGLSMLERDIMNISAEDVKQFDVVVNAFSAPPGSENLHVEAGKVLIEAFKGAPDTRLIVVGGAGSLFVDEEKTQRLYETNDFPEAYFPTAKNMANNLRDLEKTNSIKWTYISPAAFFDPQGLRTGKYKVGKDNLIFNSKGESYISYADYAIAVLDEIENQKHINQRFTVVSEKE
jgi:putative NADH-flavin reductase